MAAGSPYTNMEEELMCPICLECLKDPVTLDCGHNFCRVCITRYCDTWEGLGALECPVCKAEIQKGNFRTNWQLANLTKKMRETIFHAKNPGTEDLCPRHKQKLNFFCKDDEKFVCRFCKQSSEHRGHSVLYLQGAADLHEATVVARKGRVCQKHQEPLKLFCKDDEALICVVCDRSKEHRDHETLPLEEASQEYKDKFCNCLEILKKTRERIVAGKADIVKESQDLLKQNAREKQETVAKFRELRSFLEEQEKLLLDELKEVAKEVEKNQDQHLAEFSNLLSSLDSFIREMEEKCQQSACELLQDVRSTLLRCKETEAFEKPVVFPLALKCRIWNVLDFNPLWENIKKQFRDTLDSGFHLQTANVTLDPDTAHPKLILSEDRKSMKGGEKAQDVPDNLDRFDRHGAVLGHEGFTAGCHFWDVLVGSEERWALGVAKKSVKRKGLVIFSPEEGVWAVGKWGGRYRAAIKDHNPPLSLSGEPKRIRVCLNYAGGRVAFFDVDRAAVIYEFSGASFNGEAVLPIFSVYKKGHLELSCNHLFSPQELEQGSATFNTQRAVWTHFPRKRKHLEPQILFDI